MELGEVLISESEIAQAVSELAIEIGEDYMTCLSWCWWARWTGRCVFWRT